MITLYDEQCIETPIKENHAQVLVDIADSLGPKYNGLICSTLTRFPGAKENLQVRSRQLDSWLKSGAKDSFVLEIFIPEGEGKFYIIVELRNIKDLTTAFGKRHGRSCAAYIATYAFSESAATKKKIAALYRELRKSIKDHFPLKKLPPMSLIRTVNKTFDSLKKKAKRTEEPTGVVLTALDMFKDRNFRDTILRARQAKDPTISNIAKSIGLDQSVIRPILLKATSKGILMKEYDIVCTGCAKVLARVANKAAVLRMANDKVCCPSCGISIGRASYEEAFTVPPKVGQLLDGSKWMCLYAWRILRSLGVPPWQILIEVIDGPNELDLVANLDGELVLMELKDTRFSIGHAYSFVGKCSQYDPNISIIMSTDGIGPDVKEYIKNTGITTHYVEEINKLDTELKAILSGLYSIRLTRLIREVAWDSFLTHSLLSRFGLSDKFGEEERFALFSKRMFRRLRPFE